MTGIDIMVLGCLVVSIMLVFGCTIGFKPSSFEEDMESWQGMALHFGRVCLIGTMILIVVLYFRDDGDIFIRYAAAAELVAVVAVAALAAS